MPKVSKEQTEQDEMKVMQELEKNSRNSYDALAKNCGCSRQKIWRIIKKLEKTKTVWGYTAVIDKDKQRLKQYFILIKRTSKPAPKDKLDMIVSRELKQEALKIGVNVVSSYYVHGSFNWHIGITASDIFKVKKFLNLFNQMFAEDLISDIQILEVIFPVERNGFINPNIKSIEDFFK